MLFKTLVKLGFLTKDMSEASIKIFCEKLPDNRYLEKLKKYIDLLTFSMSNSVIKVTMHYIVDDKIETEEITVTSVEELFNKKWILFCVEDAFTLEFHNTLNENFKLIVCKDYL